MTHSQLKKEVMKAIDALFRDTSVDKSTTKEALKEIAEEIEIKIDSLGSV